MINLEKNSKISVVEKEDKGISAQPKGSASLRPDVVNAKVYKVKSAFVKKSVFITLGYIETESGRRPIEIFINSKDLNRSAEYVVLTRLISAIFRRATDPMFILEELHGITDPNGGAFQNGQYFHSFYAEVAHVIKQFFFDVGIVKKNNETNMSKSITHVAKETQKMTIEEPITPITQNETEINIEFRICPDCQAKALKTENGCDMCMECGYSKCDK